MKRFILKTTNLLLNLIIIGGVLVTLFNVTIQFLPEELVLPILNWFNSTKELLIPTTLSTAIATVTLFIGKYFHTSLKFILKNSEYKQELQRSVLEDKFNKLRELTLEKDEELKIAVNKLIELQNINTNLYKTIIEYNKINAKKNSTNSILPNKLKSEYKKWAESLDIVHEIKSDHVIDAPQPENTQVDKTPKETTKEDTRVEDKPKTRSLI